MGQTRPLVPHRLPANVTEGWGSAFHASGEGEGEGEGGAAQSGTAEKPHDGV